MKSGQDFIINFFLIWDNSRKINLAINLQIYKKKTANYANYPVISNDSSMSMISSWISSSISEKRSASTCSKSPLKKEDKCRVRVTEGEWKKKELKRGKQTGKQNCSNYGMRDLLIYTGWIKKVWLAAFWPILVFFFQSVMAINIIENFTIFDFFFTLLRGSKKIFFRFFRGRTRFSKQKRCQLWISGQIFKKKLRFSHNS